MIPYVTKTIPRRSLSLSFVLSLFLSLSLTFLLLPIFLLHLLQTDRDVDAKIAAALASVFSVRTPSFATLVACIESIYAACMEHGKQLFALLLQVRTYDRSHKTPCGYTRTHTHTYKSLPLSLSLSLFFQYAPTKTILEAMFQAGLSAPKVDATEAEEGQTETLTERWFGTLMKLQGLVSS